MLQRPGDPNPEPRPANGDSAAFPEWVVWNDGPVAGRATVVAIGADAGLRVVNASSIPIRVLDAITDRSVATCAPPFGVLSRSELLALHPPEAGTTVITKLTTLGVLATTANGIPLTGCGADDTCDASVPVWVQISSAPDPRFTDRESRLNEQQRNTGASWQVVAYDARTGPQDTSLNGVASGPGAAQADLIAIPDLAPA
jgi:hypothetical protein